MSGQIVEAPYRGGPTRRVRAAVALGSNLGDREARIASGVRALRREFEDLRVSSLYETEPAHITDQPPFLNACCTGRTGLTPRQLLSQLQDAERAAGRQRSGPRFGPRALDLDLILYGDEVIQEPDLVVPHPRLRERGFVLVPLAEIASQWIVPASHGEPARSVESLSLEVGAAGIRKAGTLGV